MKRKILLPLLLVVAVASITGCGKKEKETREVENYNTAFFIKEGSKYALFSDEGKQLTGFDFTYASTISNGTALVKIDDVSAVIKADGKMLIDLGKYKYIYRESGLYKVNDENGNQYLLDSKGKKIADMADKELSTYIGEEYLLLLDKTKNEYTVLDSKGNSLVTFAKGDSEEKPSTNEAKNFVSVYNNGKNYILDLISAKKLLEFDADAHYCVNNASDDGKIITLNSCVGTFQKQDKVTYRVIKDGKLYDLSDKCDTVGYNGENLTCKKDSKNYLLDSNLNVGISTDSASYTDSEHYAKAKSGSFNGIDFYEKDNVVKNVECRTMHEYGYNKSGLIILTTYFSKPCGTQSGSYEFYNNKGEKQFDKTFASAQKFDDNGFARVSEDRQTYYLIDTKGNKVTDDYKSISTRSDYYVVSKDELVGLLDEKAKVIVEPKYKSVDILTKNGVKYAKFTTTDSKYVIYNLKDNKEVATFDSAPNTTSNDYMVVTRDGKKVYYTYTGKEFYTENN